MSPSTIDPRAVELMFQMRPHYEKIESFTTILHRWERIGRKRFHEREVETMEAFFRKPFDIRFTWINGKHKGRRLLFRQGHNREHIRVREGGALGLFHIDVSPESKLLKLFSHHPIYHAGFGFVIERMHDETEKMLEVNKGEMRYEGIEAVHERQAHKISRDFDEYEEEWIYCPKGTVWVDTEMFLPIRVENYDKEGELFEMFCCENLKVNQPIDSRVFDFDKV